MPSFHTDSRFNNKAIHEGDPETYLLTMLLQWRLFKHDNHTVRYPDQLLSNTFNGRSWGQIGVGHLQRRQLRKENSNSQYNKHTHNDL